MPILRLLLGLPKRVFFSASAFFGGILSLTLRGMEVENTGEVNGLLVLCVSRYGRKRHAANLKFDQT